MAKILVADDNSNIQKMVTLALKDQGIDVVSVGNGEAAVRKLPDVSPDLVLADIFMPVRNGYEVCEFVKQDARFANIPVILLVGAFDPLDETEVQRVGADGVLKKPFVPPEPLIAMVKSMLERSIGSPTESAAVGATPTASSTAPSASEAKPAPSIPEAPAPSPPASAGLKAETEEYDEYIEPVRTSPFAEPNLGMTSEREEEDIEAGAPRFRGAAFGDQLWGTYGETEKSGENSEQKEVEPLEDLLSRQEKASLLEPLELEDGKIQKPEAEAVETEARTTEGREVHRSTRVDPGSAGIASTGKPDDSLDAERKPTSLEWSESWAAKASDVWSEKSIGSAPVDEAPAPPKAEAPPGGYPDIDLNQTLAAIRAAHGLPPSEPQSAPEPPVPLEAEHEEVLERFVRPGIFGQAIPFQDQAGGPLTEQHSDSLMPHETAWPAISEPPRLPIEEEPRAKGFEPEAVRSAEPRTPAGWLDALSPAPQEAEPSREPERFSSFQPAIGSPAEPASTYQQPPREAAPAEQGAKAPSDELTDEAAIQAAVDKVVERMQGQMLDVVTREVLRPVVEALVRREMKKP